jgi:Cu+-exporting ATPase
MARDPVCGMACDPRQAVGKSEYQGETYYFCAPGCKEEFDRHPEQYIGREAGGQERR